MGASGNNHQLHHHYHHRPNTRSALLSPYNILVVFLLVQLGLCLFYVVEMRRCDKGVTRETLLNVHIPRQNNIDRNQNQRKRNIDSSEEFPMGRWNVAAKLNSKPHGVVREIERKSGEIGVEIEDNILDEMFQDWSDKFDDAVKDKPNPKNLSDDKQQENKTFAPDDNINPDYNIVQSPLSDPMDILPLKKIPVMDFKEEKYLTKGSLGNILVKLSGRLKGHVPQMLPKPGEVIHDQRRNFTILTSTNAAFLDFTENWLLSLKRIGIKHTISIIAEDKVAYNFLSRTYSSDNIHIYATKNFSSAKSLQFLSAEYNNLVNRRAEYMLHFLRDGVDVLAADVDAYWFRDPIEIIYGTYDVYDVWVSLGADEKRPCPCFMYLKAKPNVIEMVRVWSLRLQRLEGQENDQEALGQILWKYKVQKGSRVAAAWLDKNLFPTGEIFFSPSWWWEHGKRVYVIHANRIGNHDKKVALFREYNLWLIEPYNVDLSDPSEKRKDGLNEDCC